MQTNGNLFVHLIYFFVFQFIKPNCWKEITEYEKISKNLTKKCYTNDYKYIVYLTDVTHMVSFIGQPFYLFQIIFGPGTSWLFQVGDFSSIPVCICYYIYLIDHFYRMHWEKPECVKAHPTLYQWICTELIGYVTLLLLTAFFVLKSRYIKLGVVQSDQVP